MNDFFRSNFIIGVSHFKLNVCMLTQTDAHT